MNDKLEYVRGQLVVRGEQRQLAKVAVQTGVSRSTIGKIMAGSGLRVSTLDTLFDFLKANARKRDL